MKSQRIHLPLLLLVAVFIACFALLGIKRLDIDTDVTKSLPAHEQIIVDALDIFKNHPIHDQVAVDIMIDREAPDTLVECASFLQEKMRASGLFEEIGMGEVVSVIPEIARQVVNQLPLLFSQEELEKKVAPRLQDEAIRQRLQTVMAGMSSLEGIGQSFSLAIDPLGLKDLVLSRLINLAPSNNARIYKGNLISEDGRHLLLIARPAKSGSNTAAAQQIADLFSTAGRELSQRFASAGRLVLTPTGTFQAALDNEKMIRHDVNLALGLSTAGIALLLFLAFPRPAFAFLSLVPPLAGMAAALFVYSLFHSSISIMVLGFSGALVSIMDDFSITYLLFFDRPQVTRGRQAAKEVQSIGGLIALLTTIASFLVLSMSDFPIFAQLGEFTALGLSFTYLFIYFVYPKIFPVMPPAAKRTPPLHTLSRWLFSAGMPGLVAAILLACVMLFFARPQFHLSLADMNTVSQKTQEDNRMFTTVWGDIGQKVYLMTSAASRDELQSRNDGLLEKMEGDLQANRIQSVFNPSMIFPGRDLAEKNRAAWKSFWTPERVEQVRRNLVDTGTALGLRPNAFSDFFALLEPDTALHPAPLSTAYDRLLSITQSDRLVEFITITPGAAYDAPRFFNDYGKKNKIFDPAYFSSSLSRILFSTFASSLAIMTAVVTLMLFIFFLNWRLTVICLLPLVFAYICTLGTLNLIGHPLDIPGLMLTVVILGVGVDYTLYTICGRQRYQARTHTSNILVYSAILLSASSTLIGFGVLCFAEHATLRSLGITSVCGIGYSFLGTILLLPPILEAYFRPEGRRPDPAGTPGQRILRRYRLTETYPRLFARFKLNHDPLFSELPHMLGGLQNAGRILDIGCGYGLPACWCLEHLPKAQIVGIDPDSERVRIARIAVQERGTILEGSAPGLPQVQGRFDCILLLDMLHYLDDDQLRVTLAQTRNLLTDDGLLLIRFVIRPTAKQSLYWGVEDFRARSFSSRASYRTCNELTAIMTACGYEAVKVSASANRELFWATGRLCSVPIQAV